MSLENMKKRMIFDGGASSDGRNARGKYLSFKSALNNSYQAEDIIFNRDQYRCLINPDKLKEDYDQKEISIDFEAKMKNGDTFYWPRTDSHWIVYLQKDEEEAYFRASIRKCNYFLNINNNKYWVYTRGPVETALEFKQKHQINFNEMNYSLLFYVTKNEETLEYLKRFQIIKFDNHNWRISAVDKYSQDGIIEVYAEEYFDNEMEDQMIIPQDIIYDKRKPYIDGPQKIRAWDTGIEYFIRNSADGDFIIESDKVSFVQVEDKCVVNVLTGRFAKIKIIYRAEGQDDVELEVRIESL